MMLIILNKSMYKKRNRSIYKSYTSRNNFCSTNRNVDWCYEPDSLDGPIRDGIITILYVKRRLG